MGTVHQMCVTKVLNELKLQRFFLPKPYWVKGITNLHVFLPKPSQVKGITYWHFSLEKICNLPEQIL